MAIELTEQDIKELENKNGDYFLEKGGSFYDPKTYDKAFEYYHLGAMIGNAGCMCCLGYCYMYGRSVEKNISLAYAYFLMAAKRKNIDALYKLGTFYSNGIYVEKNEETAYKYYREAAWLIEKDDQLTYQQFPSLAYALGLYKLKGDYIPKDYYGACILLNIARAGYEVAIENGSAYYSECLDKVLYCLENQYLEDYISRITMEDITEYSFSSHPGMPKAERTVEGKSVKFRRKLKGAPVGTRGVINEQYLDNFFEVVIFGKTPNKNKYIKCKASDFIFIPQITLQLYPGQLPISDSDFETGDLHTGIEAVDTNEIIKKCNKEFGHIFKALYTKKSETVFELDADAMKKNRFRLMGIMKEMMDEFKRIDDKSYMVVDYVTFPIKYF